jgi:hypothetical protein
MCCWNFSNEKEERKVLPSLWKDREEKIVLIKLITGEKGKKTHVERGHEW